MNTSLPCALVALASLFLTACGDKNIELVKQQKLQSDNSFTIGQAYDNRPVCKDISWREYKDEKERTIVEYQCELKGVEEFSKIQLAQKLQIIEIEKNAEIEQLKTDILLLKKKIPKLSNIIAALKKERAVFARTHEKEDAQYFMKIISTEDNSDTSVGTYRFDWVKNYIWSSGKHQCYFSYPIWTFCNKFLIQGAMDKYIQALEVDLSQMKVTLEESEQSIEARTTAIELSATSKVAEAEGAFLFAIDQVQEVHRWAVNDKDMVFLEAFLKFRSNKKNEEIINSVHEYQKLEHAILGKDVNEYINYVPYFQ